MSDIASALNKPIGKKQKYPTKTALNLYEKKKDSDSPLKLAVTALLLLAFILLFAKIAVIDRLNEVNEARQSYAALEAQKKELESALSDYDEVLEDYYRYTESYLSEGDAVLVDRIEIMEMLKKQAGASVEITAVSINDNTVVLTIRTDALEDAGSYKERLETEEMVRSVTVYNAEKTMVRNRYYTAYNGIIPEFIESEPEYLEVVTATMMIQVSYPEK